MNNDNGDSDDDGHEILCELENIERLCQQLMQDANDGVTNNQAPQIQVESDCDDTQRQLSDANESGNDQVREVNEHDELMSAMTDFLNQYLQETPYVVINSPPQAHQNTPGLNDRNTLFILQNQWILTKCLMSHYTLPIHHYFLVSEPAKFPPEHLQVQLFDAMQVQEL